MQASQSVLAISTRTPRRISRICRLVLLVSLTARAVPPPAGIAPVTVPPGGFSIDGNVVANSSAGDWVAGSNGGAGVLSSSGVPLNPSTTFRFTDPYNSSTDNTFGAV